MSDKATLEINGEKYELPLKVGTENEVAIDIKTLRSATGGVITIDPGYKNTGSCESAITFLDGEKGILRYRGYSIEELAQKSSFLETAFLLIWGELPSATELRDFEQEDEKERIASEYQLNYISLDGTVGCMVNGAGLAMATMDLIEYHGGSPANFLDVGGSTTAERVAKAFEIIQSGQNVKAILVNIFGGIVHCDLIAEGILQAIEKVGLTLPIVVRLEGTNAPKGLKILNDSDFNIMTEADLTQAAKQVVEMAK